MDERMTICNMSIEAGARAGMIAPDETTFAYLKGRRFAPQGAAWDKANALLADVERKTGAPMQPTNTSAERLLGYAARGDVHDERLWMGIARATGAPGNTSCLVGTPEQIAAAVLEYYRLGIHSFLLRGFENPHDTMAIGRDLIPLIKAGALEIDQQAEAAE